MYRGPGQELLAGASIHAERKSQNRTFARIPETGYNKVRGVTTKWQKGAEERRLAGD
jgi:hypothetical protein